MGRGELTKAEGSIATLSNYYVNRFILDDEDGSLNNSQNAMGLEISFRKSIDDEMSAPVSYRIVMSVSIAPGTEEPTEDSPCQLELTGEFQTTQDATSDEAIREYLRIYGASELYAITKTVMASLTALAPSGVIMLPSVAFDKGNA